MKARTLYSRVSIEADIDSLEDSRQATAAVLRARRDRLTPVEATLAVAQLPQELKRLWASGRPALHQPMKLLRRDFLERVLPFIASLGIALTGGERRRNPDRADRSQETVHDRVPI